MFVDKAKKDVHHSHQTSERGGNQLILIEGKFMENVCKQISRLIGYCNIFFRIIEIFLLNFRIETFVKNFIKIYQLRE